VLTGVPLPFLGTAGVYYPVVAFVVVCFVFQWILSMTSFGRHVYAVGETKRRPGFPASASRSPRSSSSPSPACWPVSPARSMRLTARRPIRSPANPFELDAIAAAVIGGTSLLTLLDNVLGINGVSDNDQLIVKGLIVVLAVVLQRPDFFHSIAGIFTKSQRSS
jgi:ribose transport system permease protein